MCRIFFIGFVSVALLLALVGSTSAFYLQNPLLDQWGYFWPSDAAAGPDGSLYMAGSGYLVQVFDEEGHFRSAFSVPNEPSENLMGFPSDIAINSQGVVYATQSGGKIRAFSSDGRYLFQTNGGGLIKSVTDIAVGASDELFVLDGSARAVHVLDSQGIWLRSFGQAEGGPTLSVGTPIAMATDANRRIFITGSCDCVGVFDPSGNPLGNFSYRDIGRPREGRAIAISADHLYVGGRYSGTIDRYTQDGTFVDTAYGFPVVDEMGVGPNGEVYIVHRLARSVDRVTPQDFAARQVGVTRLFDRPFVPYGRIPEILDNTGIGRANRAAETAAETFIVPGEPGEIVELAFSFFHKEGAYEPRFAVFNRDLVTADPIDQPLEFGIQALEARLLEFTKPPLGHSLPDDTPIGTINVAAGTELGFFMFGNIGPYRTTDNVIELLRSNMERLGANELYEQLHPGRHFPYFSIAAVNHGRVDQFVTFLGEDFTVVAAEDDPIRSGSDVDLMDMVIKINARLIPVPEPAAGALAIIAGALFSLAFAHRRRRILV